jgi:hypothetical protein
MDEYEREEHGIISYKHNMTSFTHPFKYFDMIPAAVFPYVITFKNEIISNILDNFTDLSIFEHKPYVDEGVIAVTGASLIGERGT